VSSLHRISTACAVASILDNSLISKVTFVVPPEDRVLSQRGT
jgi:hypothetical protein